LPRDFVHKYWQEKLLAAVRYFIPQIFVIEKLGGHQEIIYKNHVSKNNWWLLGDSHNDYWLGFLPKILAEKMFSS
jgi:hypothetical protein